MRRQRALLHLKRTLFFSMLQFNRTVLKIACEMWAFHLQTIKTGNPLCQDSANKDEFKTHSDKGAKGTRCDVLENLLKLWKKEGNKGTR